MSKLFTVAGTSSLDGVVKFRVANGTAAARANVLEKNGHTCIELQDLPKGMTKEDAFAFVQANGGATAAKAPKDKLVEAVKREGRAFAKKKANKEFKVKNKAEVAPKVEQDADTLAAIKAKNLETMRKVTAKQSRFSAETEAMQAQVRAEFAEMEADMDKLTAADIPAIFRKECGFAE
jgi:hypothetical protein